MGMNLFRQWYFRRFVLGLIVLLLGCSPGTKERPGPPAVPVTVAPVIQKTVPVQLRTIGNVQAYSTVSVKSLVAGELIRVYFIEGQDVKKGDLLFTIDPRPFEATVRQAEANLAKDLALVKEAEANLAKAISQVKEVEATLAKDMAQQKYAQMESQRYEELFKRGVVAKEQYDKVRLDTETIQATIEADRAAVDNAEEAVGAAKAAVETAKESVLTDRAVLENATIQLGYCSIRSPLSGRTGNLIVQQGNIVKANDTPFLVVINQINPINVTFSAPEKYLPEIRKYMATGRIKVEAVVPDHEAEGEKGELSFIDNTVDPTTGTIQVKGIFANKEKHLWPGQFVEVILTLTVQPNAIVIPSQAVKAGQKGPYVFVVKGDHTVELRPILPGQKFHEETVIEGGLSPGETVVADGQLQLVPGSRVEIKNPTTAIAPKESNP